MPYKKKGVVKDEKLALGVPEPERISMFDVVKDNLKLANRVTYVHRVIYLGEHSFNENTVINIFDSVVKKVNSEYCDEKLSGFLLVYTKYLVHMVEADEDTINRHFKYLYSNSQYINQIGKMKLLILIPHINQRFSQDWHHYTSVPPALLEPIDPYTDLENTSRYVITCLRKMYGLIAHFIFELETEHDTAEAADLRSSRSMSGRSSKIGITKQDPFIKFLPEYLLLDFLINTPHTMSIYTFYKLYGDVPQRVIYKDMVWPVPSDFVPYYIFDPPYNPVIDLPKEMIEFQDDEETNEKA